MSVHICRCRSSGVHTVALPCWRWVALGVSGGRRLGQRVLPGAVVSGSGRALAAAVGGFGRSWVVALGAFGLALGVAGLDIALMGFY